MARELGVSLGKVANCMQALLNKGGIKAENFNSSRNEIAYFYLLTPDGIERKAKIGVKFLIQKTAEFEEIKREIEQLSEEVTQAQNQCRTTDPEHTSL